jgi:hypothetical protein
VNDLKNAAASAGCDFVVLTGGLHPSRVLMALYDHLTPKAPPAASKGKSNTSGT